MKIKGITIDLGVNTKPVTEGFQKINKELNTTDKTLRDINKSLKLDPGNSELLEQKQKYLNKAIEETNKKLEEEQKILAELEKADGGSGKYEQQMDALKREIVDTTNKQKAYRDELENIGNESVETANDTKTLEDSFFNASLKAEIVTKAVELAAEAFKQLVNFVKEAVTASAEYADNILTESKVLGLTTDQLQEYYYMSELVDVSVDTIGGAMTKLEKNMYSAAKGSKSMQASFSKLGITLIDANGELKDSEVVFGEALDALGGIANETERDALAMEIFGRSAKDLNPLILAGSDAINQYRQEAYEMGYVLDNETLDALGGMDDAFRRLDNATTIVKNQIGAALAPIITDITNKFMAWMQSVDWEAFREQIGTFINGVIELVQFLWPILETIISAVVGLLSKVWNVLKTIADVAKTAWNGLATAIQNAKDRMAPVISAIVGLFQSVWDKAQAVVGKVQELGNWLGSVGNSISGFFSRAGRVLGFSSGGFASGGFASGGSITLYSTINVNNNGQTITQNDVIDWADTLTTRINKNLGRLV